MSVKHDPMRICDRHEYPGWAKLECPDCRIEELEAETQIHLSAIEGAYDFITETLSRCASTDTDVDQACCRCVRRELMESIGEAAPKLIMERPEGQKLYGLRYRELKSQVRKLEAKLERVRGLPDKWRDEGPEGEGWDAFLCADELRAALTEETP